MDTGTPVKGPRRLGDGGRLGAIMAASLGASALIASNSGLAQQVLLRNHIAGTYYQLSNGAVYSSYSGSYGQFYGAQATHTAVPAATATTAPSTGGGDTGGGGASATATTAPSTNNANPLAPGQTGLNPGQSGGTAGPPGQTGANPGQASSQAAGPTIGLTLPSGRIIEVNIPQGLLNNLPPGIRNAMRIDFNPAPVTQNEVQAGSLGGGQVTTVLSPPIDIRITTRDPLTGAPLALTPETLAQVVQVALPILINNLASLPSGSDFQWLRELRDSASGGFLGYVLQPNTFDPGAGVKRYSMTIGDLQGTLFLPTVLTQAWVQNHDPNVHIYSGPLAGDTDFGVAAPQFTTFTVVAPQVGSRLYVFNPRTGNYGWIDVAGIGPAGRPAS